ncbi:MAG: hypothetical protein LBU32_31420 [Clostridiales bacterium]|nr:hypothetical protein [Clostridiales bacterium]
MRFGGTPQGQRLNTRQSQTRLNAGTYRADTEKGNAVNRPPSGAATTPVRNGESGRAMPENKREDQL